MEEIVKHKHVIELEQGAYPFYISGLNQDNSPCFTAEIGNAIHYNSQSRALIDIEKVRAARFTMKLVAKPLEISYLIGGK